MVMRIRMPLTQNLPRAILLSELSRIGETYKIPFPIKGASKKDQGVDAPGSKKYATELIIELLQAKPALTRWFFAFWEPELPASGEQVILFSTGRFPRHPSH